jgi:hypothetical protein
MSLATLLLLAVAGQLPPEAADAPDAGVELVAPSPEAPAAAPAPIVQEAPTPEAAPVAVTAKESPGARRLPGPGLGVAFGDSGVELRLMGALRLAQTVGSDVVLDDEGTTIRPAPFETRLRLGPELRYRGVSLVTEFDLATGALLGVPEAGVVAAKVPVPRLKPAELRQAYFQYRWATGGVRVGYQLSHFGQGMLANGGSEDPVSGDFGMQRGGNYVLRAAYAGRPLFELGGIAQLFEPILAVDLVVKDATADLLAGDRAIQGIAGLRFVVDEKSQVGVLAIYRNQRRDNATPGERALDAFVADVFGTWSFVDRKSLSFSVGGEAVAIFGTTTQGRSDTAPVLDVRQFGAVGTVRLRAGRFGLLLDGGFASGDQNPYDAGLNNFRFDPNYKMGLVLFDQVLGYQSARTALRAADPQLVGVPPEGVDLLPTAGAITGAWYVFPRLNVALADWVDMYGGPLFAFATARPTDPYTTRLNGGVPLNSLGGSAGHSLGTELDLGITFRTKPSQLLNLSATLEGGVLLPGDGFRTAAGGVMGPTGLGRLRLTLSL